MYLWVLVLPALLVILFTQAYPFVYSLVLSFRQWTLSESDVPLGFTFGNYKQAITNMNFWYSCRVSILFMFKTIIIELILGFFIAYLFIGSSRAIKVARTVVLIPMAIAPVVSGNMWRILFDTKSGIINLMLQAVGIPGPNWLGDPTWAVNAIVIASIWQYVSFSFLIYTAYMTSIPNTLVEAAQIDGATRWGIIKHIYIPMTMQATLLILIFRIVDAFFIFDQVYTLTSGGPGTATQVISLYIYNEGLTYFHIGYSAACSWVVMIFVFIICGFILKLKDKVADSYN
jgi:multiple sugar transport system permease protein